MLDFFNVNESLINILSFPIVFILGSIAINIENENLKESSCLGVFLVFLFMMFNVLYNGLIKGF